MDLEFGTPGEAYWPLWPFAVVAVGAVVAIVYLRLAEWRGWWPFK